MCVEVARRHCAGYPVYPITTAVADLDLTKDEALGSDSYSKNSTIACTLAPSASTTRGTLGRPLPAPKHIAYQRRLDLSLATQSHLSARKSADLVRARSTDLRAL